MFKFIEEIKNSKEKQQAILDKVATMPWLIKSVTATANYGARAVAPLWMLAGLATCKQSKHIIFLHRLVRDELKLKRDLYISLMGEKADSYGFIEYETCDSLLFTGLVGAVGWKTIITKARDENGAWHRRDVDCPCYPGGSRSTISRDMLLGLLWYIWRNDRLDLAKDLWDYGTEHGWIMGEGDVSRIYFTPGLQATLAEIIYQLGGTNYRLARAMPQSWSKGLKGFQAHLEGLHIALRGELLGYITPNMSKALNDICTRYPENSLFCLIKARFADSQNAANVNGNLAAFGLEDPQIFPKDRLPTDADRSSRWYFENNDRTPGEDKTEDHSGGDLVFCASLILDYSDNIG